MNILRLLIGGVSLLGFAPTVGLAATWEMPTPYGDESFQTVNIRQFAADVKKATAGRLEIRVRSAGSLFEHAAIPNAVQRGRAPLGEFLLSRLANQNAVFEVDSIPFLATGYEAARALWAASRDPIAELLSARGLRVLFSVPWPPQGLYTHQEVTSVEDLRGVAFRVYSSTTERFARLAGAIPASIEIPDIPGAFASGRVHAMITSPSTGVNTKAWEFVDRFYNTRAWLPKNVVVANAAAFEHLDATTRAAVLAAAVRAEARGWAMSKAETAAKIAVLEQHGMKVSDPSARLENGLESIGETMTAEWLERTGPAGKAILSMYARETKIFAKP